MHNRRRAARREAKERVKVGRVLCKCMHGRQLQLEPDRTGFVFAGVKPVWGGAMSHRERAQTGSGIMNECAFFACVASLVKTCKQ